MFEIGFKNLSIQTFNRLSLTTGVWPTRLVPVICQHIRRSLVRPSRTCSDGRRVDRRGWLRQPLSQSLQIPAVIWNRQHISRWSWNTANIGASPQVQVDTWLTMWSCGILVNLCYGHMAQLSLSKGLVRSRDEHQQAITGRQNRCLVDGVSANAIYLEAYTASKDWPFQDLLQLLRGPWVELNKSVK